MPLPNDIRLYDDIRQHLDRAISSAGIRITCHSYGAAVNLRQRLQKLRQLEKLKSVELFLEPEDPRRATTPWDHLSMTIEKGSNVLFLIPDKKPLEVEDL